MSGVWIFGKNGVARLISYPTRESFEQQPNQRSSSNCTATAPGARPRVLVYVPTEQIIRSHADLELRLGELGWTRYPNPTRPDLIQFHRSDASCHLISLPSSFSRLKPFHLYDIVVKNRSFFQVRTVNVPSDYNKPTSSSYNLST